METKLTNVFYSLKLDFMELSLNSSLNQNIILQNLSSSLSIRFVFEESIVKNTVNINTWVTESQYLYKLTVRFC